MQTTNSLETEIRMFIIETVIEDLGQPLDRGNIDDDAPMGGGGIDLDSLSLIELTMRLERRFSIEYHEDSIEPVGAMSLGELVADTVRRGARA